ncbi:hypothetical protein EV421DRAFT_1889154 [Armillaria borealis]|uniref:CxC5 like cysteine cluster associated with KDZ domain-containing protein n=1 Tax=Armillaria borealis TaxID=47425 RepID=A0AA39JWY8_9AGAR|nr:hypothetical protein EV421DRAFT_1889154 [Armillaria borealis]
MATIQQSPKDISFLNLSQIVLYICIGITLKPDILLPPKQLTTSFISFLLSACGISIKHVGFLWTAFKHIIWEEDEFLHIAASPETLRPPCNSCINPFCQYIGCDFKLQGAVQLNAILFTMSHGPIPIWVVHFMCYGCKQIYHHNYYIKNGMRFYYNIVPDIIQIGDHQFVEKRLVESWRLSMNLAWVFASNLANIYTQMHCQNLELPSDWTIGAILSHQHVYTGIICLSLWEDHDG